MSRSVLGTLRPAQFLRRHWQREPLLVKAALPEARDRFAASELRALCRRDDVESRLVTHDRGRWQVAHGPFKPSALRRPAGSHWSLLVQGVDSHLARARELLDLFAFIPYARTDDVMLSLAPPGGGVGPHFDSYDVFLLQIHGRRRWRIGAQNDLHLVDGAPLRILRNFRPEQEFEVDPGDLLYLPPRYAHDGVALTDCITCSIGFRAPARQELASAFLQWLAESLKLEGRYGDRGLAPQRHPAAIGDAMIRQVEQMLAAVRWRRKQVETFLGEYLTEPKPQVWFQAPQPTLGFAAFVAQWRARGIRLSLKTRMLYRGQLVFINGESLVVPRSARAALTELANQRTLSARHSRSKQSARVVYEWYRTGYVELLS